ncbi:MAG: hypothetical protein ACLTSZ_09035 [Lachnospiraceae bacterium]
MRVSEETLEGKRMLICLHELRKMMEKRPRHPSLPEVIDVPPEKGLYLADYGFYVKVVYNVCVGFFGGGDFRDGIFSIAGQLSEVLGYCGAGVAVNADYARI